MSATLFIRTATRSIAHGCDSIADAQRILAGIAGDARIDTEQTTETFIPARRTDIRGHIVGNGCRYPWRISGTPEEKTK